MADTYMTDKPHAIGPLRVGGKHGGIVTDDPVNGTTTAKGDEEDVARGWTASSTAYGGHLVAESITPANARRLVACWNICQGTPTEALEAAYSAGARLDVSLQVSVALNTNANANANAAKEG